MTPELDWSRARPHDAPSPTLPLAGTLGVPWPGTEFFGSREPESLPALWQGPVGATRGWSGSPSMRWTTAPLQDTTFHSGSTSRVQAAPAPLSSFVPAPGPVLAMLDRPVDRLRQLGGGGVIVGRRGRALVGSDGAALGRRTAVEADPPWLHFQSPRTVTIRQQSDYGRPEQQDSCRLWDARNRVTAKPDLAKSKIRHFGQEVAPLHVDLDGRPTIRVGRDRHRNVEHEDRVNHRPRIVQQTHEI